MAELTHTLPVTLQQARKARRLSQLELSLRVGVSQRHISFVESGRAKPSRPLLLAWLQELDAPLAVRNAAMLQAGYAPAYGETLLDDPALAQAHSAIQHLLQSHDPMPALAFDAHWNLLHINRGGSMAGCHTHALVGESAHRHPTEFVGHVDASGGIYTAHGQPG
jgi:transcriptional regulator with XRE-family HTH domain